MADRLDTILELARAALRDDERTQREAPSPWSTALPGSDEWRAPAVRDANGDHVCYTTRHHEAIAAARTREPMLAAWVAAVAPAIADLARCHESMARDDYRKHDTIDALLAAAEGCGQ